MTELIQPSGCGWCGIARRGHGRQYVDAAGWHEWEQPSQEQMLARMKARRLQLAVAKVGALPMPVGDERTVAVVEEELTAANLAFWSLVQAYGRLRLALASAQRDRRELRARVAELEAGLRTVNTQRGDAAQLIERELGQGETHVQIDEITSALMLGSDEVGDGEHYAVVHHDYRLGHDLPEAGGAR